MGYITTDFWANYPQIWLEPMYILVTAWNDKRASDQSVARRERRTEPTDLQHRAAERVLEPILADLLRRGPGRHAVDEVHVDEAVVRRSPGHAPGAKSLCVDHDGEPVAAVRRRHHECDHGRAPDVAAYLGTNKVEDVVNSSKPGTGWLDGVLLPFFDFGTDNFEANANQEIQDVPLFLFVTPDPNGVLQPAGVTTSVVSRRCSATFQVGSAPAAGRSSGRSGACTS